MPPGARPSFRNLPRALPGYGSAWKKEVKSRYVAQARVWIAGGEMLAQKENFVELDPEVKDHWGIPVLKIHFRTAITTARSSPISSRKPRSCSARPAAR